MICLLAGYTFLPAVLTLLPMKTKVTAEAPRRGETQVTVTPQCRLGWPLCGQRARPREVEYKTASDPNVLYFTFAWARGAPLARRRRLPRSPLTLWD